MCLFELPGTRTYCGFFWMIIISASWLLVLLRLTWVTLADPIHSFSYVIQTLLPFTLVRKIPLLANKVTTSENPCTVPGQCCTDSFHYLMSCILAPFFFFFTWICTSLCMKKEEEYCKKEVGSMSQTFPTIFLFLATVTDIGRLTFLSLSLDPT